MTTPEDVIVDADGTRAQGQVTLRWPMFMFGSLAIAQGHKTYEIENGQISLSLFPTVTAQPPGSYYTATFELSNGSVYDEYFIVPDTEVPVKLNQIRAMFPPEPGLFINSNQITGSNATIGQFLGWNGNQWVPMSPAVPAAAAARSAEDQMSQILSRLDAIESRLSRGGL